jgi:hypothetical protein
MAGRHKAMALSLAQQEKVSGFSDNYSGLGAKPGVALRLEDINNTSAALGSGIKLPEPSMRSLAQGPQPGSGIGAELFGGLTRTVEDIMKPDFRPDFPAPRAPGLFN